MRHHRDEPQREPGLRQGAQAIAVAVPMIIITAPVKDYGIDEDRIDPAPVELAIDEEAEKPGVDDADR